MVEPKFGPDLPEPEAALQKALRQPIEATPLKNFVPATATVGIVFSDITRPIPNHLILPVILNELHHLPAKNITLFKDPKGFKNL